MTYSIVAADPEAGLIGVAAQSHHLAVGPMVAGYRRGVGAIAVQSYGDRAHYDPVVFDALEGGATVEDALSSTFESDRRHRRSQVGFVAADGASAALTGDACVDAAGHVFGTGWSIQANMCASPAVWQDAAVAFCTSVGDLASRLLGALVAAEGAGGDLRGSQSASLVVIANGGAAHGAADVDLRIDDHPDPVSELCRLDRMRRASLEMTAAFADAAAGHVDRAIARLAAVQEVYRANAEPSAWAAVLLARADRLEEASVYAASACDSHLGWAEFLARLPKVGLLPEDPAVMRALLERHT